MIQYDLVALGWQITILVIFGGTVWFLTNRKNYLVSVDELEKHFMNRVTSVEGNTINYCNRNTEEALKKCDNEIDYIRGIVNGLRGIDTRKDVDRLNNLIDEMNKESIELTTIIADHQQDITALKTQKALS